MFSNWHAAPEDKPKRVGQLDVDAEPRHRVRTDAIRSGSAYEWAGEWRDGGCYFTESGMLFVLGRQSRTH